MIGLGVAVFLMMKGYLPEVKQHLPSPDSQTSGPATWGEQDRPLSVPVSDGTPAKALEDVVVIPFNDPETAVAILDRHRDELACVLIDPLPHRVGLMPATAEFVGPLGQRQNLIAVDPTRNERNPRKLSVQSGQQTIRTAAFDLRIERNRA